MTPQEFIAAAAPAAVVSMQQTRVPASVTIAQAADESGWGAHAPGNNYFGIKATVLTDPSNYIRFETHESRNGREVLEDDYFVRFASMQDSFVAHARLLATTTRYALCMRYTNSASLFCLALQSCRYATDPDYARKLVEIIREHNLTQYDTADIHASADENKGEVAANIEALDHVFAYHSPTPEKLPRFAAVRSSAREFARCVLMNTQRSADQVDAIRKIREAMMTANAAIALEQP